MNCEHVKGCLADYLAESLEAGALARTEAHLDSCESCARYLLDHVDSDLSGALLRPTVELVASVNPEQRPWVNTDASGAPLAVVPAAQQELPNEQLNGKANGVVPDELVLNGHSIDFIDSREAVRETERIPGRLSWRGLNDLGGRKVAVAVAATVMLFISLAIFQQQQQQPQGVDTSTEVARILDLLRNGPRDVVAAEYRLLDQARDASAEEVRLLFMGNSHSMRTVHREERLHSVSIAAGPSSWTYSGEHDIVKPHPDGLPAGGPKLRPEHQNPLDGERYVSQLTSLFEFEYKGKRKVTPLASGFEDSLLCDVIEGLSSKGQRVLVYVDSARGLLMRTESHTSSGMQRVMLLVNIDQGLSAASFLPSSVFAGRRSVTLQQGTMRVESFPMAGVDEAILGGTRASLFPTGESLTPSESLTPGREPGNPDSIQ